MNFAFIQNSAVAMASTSSASAFAPANPFFHSTMNPRVAAPSNSPRSTADFWGPSASHRGSHTKANICDHDTADDDDDSLDSIILDESPNPVRPMTPGAKLKARPFARELQNSGSLPATPSGSIMMRTESLDSPHKSCDDGAQRQSDVRHIDPFSFNRSSLIYFFFPPSCEISKVTAIRMGVLSDILRVDGGYDRQHTTPVAIT
jgi:hypothetical protein